MDRVLVETNVKHRFTEHDLRAKVASDAASLEHVRYSNTPMPAPRRARNRGSPNGSKRCDGSSVARLNETPRVE